jgi:hypothetical protein
MDNAYWPPRIVPPKAAPNVLLIMTDDVGFGAPISSPAALMRNTKCDCPWTVAAITTIAAGNATIRFWILDRMLIFTGATVARSSGLQTDNENQMRLQSTRLLQVTRVALCLFVLAMGMMG